ncbi:MAG: hypothetical protein R3B99_06575 [Polyangiales bacterium]
MSTATATVVTCIAPKKVATLMASLMPKATSSANARFDHFGVPSRRASGHEPARSPGRRAW